MHCSSSDIAHFYGCMVTKPLVSEHCYVRNSIGVLNVSVSIFKLFGCVFLECFLCFSCDFFIVNDIH